MDAIQLHWDKQIYSVLQIRNGVETSKLKQNKTKQNDIKCMQIYGYYQWEDLACDFSYYLYCPACMFQIWLPKIYILCRSSRPSPQTLPFGCCIPSRSSIVSLTLHNHYSSIEVCVLHQVSYFCYHGDSRKLNQKS